MADPATLGNRSVDYPEADSVWLIWLTVISLFAALIANRMISLR